jgi:hypothetical protein
MKRPDGPVRGDQIDFTLDNVPDGSVRKLGSGLAPSGSGPGYLATSTDSLTIGLGAFDITTQSGLAYSTGCRVRVAYETDPSIYMEGTCEDYTGTTLSITVDRTVGSGTYATWTINVAGDVGAQGDKGDKGDAGAPGDPGAPGSSGAGYGGTSTTSLVIGTGSKSFTTQAGLAYLPGVRVRAVSAANSANWMEGPVSSYSGTTLVLAVDLTGGSGTKTDWNLGVGGEGLHAAQHATGGADPVTLVVAQVTGAEATGNKGAASGYCGLDGSQLVPYANLPVGTGALQVSQGTHTHSGVYAAATHASNHAPGGSDPYKRWILYTSSNNGTGNNYNSTRYCGLHYLSPNATEANTSSRVPFTGTFASLWIYVSSFSLSGGSANASFAVRDDTSSILTITLTGTGAFTAAGPSASVASGSLCNYCTIGSATSGSYNVSAACVEYTES